MESTLPEEAIVSLNQTRLIPDPNNNCQPYGSDVIAMFVIEVMVTKPSSSFSIGTVTAYAQVGGGTPSNHTMSKVSENGNTSTWHSETFNMIFPKGTIVAHWATAEMFNQFTDTSTAKTDIPCK